jgi:hypothetical protein
MLLADMPIWYLPLYGFDFGAFLEQKAEKSSQVTEELPDTMEGLTYF